ncbi:outer membrane beta-barrel family protein [Apibacter sp. HY039]|uniref:outer membrane beta-barrel family protein n=1 Tax=Apibacter sp. HY039 TaxID=2501476 RepID=UPI000FEBE4FB|nr:outer membrane beta-barrel family protein [Apibacter sp. HY039]
MKIHFAFLFVLFFINSFCQDYEVKGKLVTNTGLSLSFAEVYLVTSDSLIVVQEDLTNEQGYFSLNGSQGEYIFQVRYEGDILLEKKIVLERNFDLGDVQVRLAKVLKRITVNGGKKLIERKVDRLIFNVDNSAQASGGDALDALRVTPRVKVQSDKISLIGKSVMRVMINDKMIELSGNDLLNYLKTIPSDNIKNIEVITNPPAKYEAEGNSGLINIKLKDAKKDFWNITLRSAYKQGVYPIGIFGGNFSYQKKKWSILFDINHNEGKSIYTNNMEYDYHTSLWKNYIRNVRLNNLNSGTFTVGYEVNKKLKIGLQYFGNINSQKDKEISGSDIFYSTGDLRYIRTQGKSNTDSYNHSVNLNLLNKLDTLGKNYTINLDYFIYNNKKRNNFASYDEISDYRNVFSDNKTVQDIKNYSAKIDFTLPYSWFTLNTGGKISFTKTINDLSALFIDELTGNAIPVITQNDYFEYKENNQAAYISTEKEIEGGWNIKTGLRAELTQTESLSRSAHQKNKKDYVKFFPTVYIQYKLNEKNDFSFNYGRRIERPSYSDMNPNKWYSNINSYAQGNPFLQPSFVDALEITYNYSSLLSTSLYYSKVKDVFGQLVKHEVENNEQIFIRENYGQQNQLGLNEVVTFKFFHFWNSYSSFSLYYDKLKANSQYLKGIYSGWSGSLYSSQSLVLNKNKTWFLEFSYIYNLPSNSGYFKINDYSEFNAAVKVNLLDKKLLLVFKLNDILKTKPTIFMLSDNVHQSFKQYYDSQYFQFSLSYIFRDNKLQLEKRQTGNEEEKNRLNN